MRTQLEKYNLLDDEWALVVEQIDAEFKTFQEKHEKMKGGLPDAKNLAELQGVSRREKDATGMFEDKCRDFEE